MSTLERTFLPSAEGDVMADIRRVAAARAGARLVLDDGTIIALPSELAEVLKVAAQLLEGGRAVTVAPTDTTLTTQQAADMLGISRPTLVTLLERGEMPFTKPGRHRRILLTDVLAFREERRGRQSNALDEIAAISQEAGLDRPEVDARRLQR